MEKKFTKGDWFPVQYASYWALQTEPYYSDKDDLLNEEDYPDGAKYNALLASNAPILLEALEYCLCIMDQCIVPESMQETYSNAIMNYSQLIEEATTLKEQ